MGKQKNAAIKNVKKYNYAMMAGFVCTIFFCSLASSLKLPLRVFSCLCASVCDSLCQTHVIVQNKLSTACLQAYGYTNETVLQHDLLCEKTCRESETIGLFIKIKRHRGQATFFNQPMTLEGYTMMYALMRHICQLLKTVLL